MRRERRGHVGAVRRTVTLALAAASLGLLASQVAAQPWAGGAANSSPGAAATDLALDARALSAPVVDADSVANSSFTDVPASHPFATEIAWLAGRGVSTGFADGTFRPTDPVSRQAMAAFLYRFAGRPVFTAPATAQFTDAPTTDPFYTEVSWLAAQGISTGYADGSFHPTDPVSRQAMAAFLYRFAHRPAFSPGASPRFTDVPASSGFYREVEWLASTGITAGYADGTFHPIENVSRQAMAAFLYRFAHHPSLGDVTAPGPVSGLGATAVTASSVSLSWTNPTDPDFAGVVIRRAQGTTPPATVGEGAAVTVTTGGTESFTDTGLAPGTTYSYAMFASDNAGNTAQPVGVTTTTLADCAPAIVHVSGALAADTTWAALGACGTVYLLDSSVAVPAGVTLTVAPGVVIKAASGAQVRVSGSLVVAGSAGSPVVFTSMRDDSAGGDTNGDGSATTPAPGNWGGLGVQGSGSVVGSFAQVRYASTGVSTPGTTNVERVELSHFTISDSQYDGVSLSVSRGGTSTSAAVVVIEDCTVRDNGGDGIEVRATGSTVPAPVVRDNTVTGSGSMALRVHGDVLDGAVLRGNGGSGNTIDAFSLSGTLSTDVQVPLGGLPLAVATDSSYRSLIVAQGVTMSVDAGQVIKLNTFTAVGPDVDAYLKVFGSLVVAGTAGSPVTFTSMRDDTAGGDTNGDGSATVPAPGDWGGLIVDGAADAPAGASLDHVRIRFSNTALSVHSPAAVRISGTVVDNLVGIRSDGAFVDARNVDWGTSAGPTASSISGEGVFYVPWVGYLPPPVPPPAEPQAVPADNAGNCKAVTVFGLRGSQESPQGTFSEASGWSVPTFGGETDGFGGYNSRVFATLEDELGYELKKVAIQYQALPVPVNGDAHVGVDDYAHSIFDGVDKLVARMKAEAVDCPGSKYVILGYSQGALAAHIALNVLEESDPQLLDDVLAVGFVSDPGRVLGGLEPWWRTGSVTNGSVSVTPPTWLQATVGGIWSSLGLMTGAGEALPSAVVGDTRALCHERDMVCSPYPGTWIDDHTNYQDGELDALAHMLWAAIE